MSNHAPAVPPPAGHHTQPQPSLYDFAAEQQKMWQALVAHQALNRQLLEAHKQLVELHHRVQRPAQVETITFTATQTVQESRERFEDPVLSIGVLNPAGAPGNVQFSGIGSATATDAFIVAPGKLLVVPVATAQIELATEAALAGSAVHFCTLMRFFNVQPAYYGG